MAPVKLMREVRCFLTASEAAQPVTNSWSGGPSVDCLAPYVTLRAVVAGEIDARTGYVCNIRALDELLRTVVAPALMNRATLQDASPAALIAAAFRAAAGRCPSGIRLHELHLLVSPHVHYSALVEELPMIRMTQSFEFSAAHRLYCADMTEEQNRRIFGKCSNPNGHGHNYVLDVTVGAAPDRATGLVVPIAELDRIVKERVIEPFDHKHLNLDCPDFADLNPSVENIARVIWRRLASAFQGPRLLNVRVWETPKTWAEYSGD